MFFFLSLVGFFIPFVLLTVYPQEDVEGLEDAPSYSPREWSFTSQDSRPSFSQYADNDDADTFELSETDSEPALEFKYVDSENDNKTEECVCRRKYQNRRRLVDYDSDTDDATDSYSFRRVMKE